MKIIKTLKVHKIFIRNFTALISGATIAQASSVILAPIVARLYFTDDFGKAALLLSIANFLSFGCTLRYNEAILLPKEDTEAVELFSISFIIMTLFCLILLILICIVLNTITSYQIINRLGGWLYSIPALVFLMGFGESLQLFSIRLKRYKTIAFSEISQALLSPSVRIFFGIIAGSTIYGLVIGLLTSYFARVGVLIINIKKNIYNVKLFKNKTRIIEIIKSYNDFPKYNLPNSFLFSFSRNMLILIFGFYFPFAIVGLLGMTVRLTRMPIGLIQRSMQKVLIPMATEKKANNKSLKNMFVKTTFLLVVIGFIPFLAIFIFGEIFVVFYLGGNWALSGSFAKLLVPIMFTDFFQTPAAVIFLVLRKQKIKLVLQIVSTTILFFSIIISNHIFMEPKVTVLIYSISGSVFNFITLLVAYRTTTNYDRKIV